MEFSDHEDGTGSLSMSGALGQSEAFIEFQEQISRVAPIERPVLIIGERGTGKELAAARVHYLSKRWQKKLVTLNCAVLMPTLIGSELFGYEKGAFTGAASRHMGRFELANEGTLFLDEIGIIPMEVQEKILRVVEYGSFERLGSSKSIQVDVRIVAAANVDLSKMAAQGRFKQDLLDRLSFEVIYVPPLRYRIGDVLLLAQHFAGRMAFELGWEEVPEFTEEASGALESYPWPGNIRELKNVVERAVYRSTTYKIKNISFNPFNSPYGNGLKASGPAEKELSLIREQRSEGEQIDADGILTRLTERPLKESIHILEQYRLSYALKKSRFNQKKAAVMLGLTYDQFRGLKKKHDRHGVTPL